MKKIILAITSVILSAILFSACTAQVSTLVIKAKWYTDLAIENVVPVTEELVYDVKFEEADSQSVKLTGFAGTYKTVLSTKKTESGEDVYELKNELNAAGKYSLEGEDDIDFSDSVVSGVVFKGLRHNLYPVSSYKNYDGHGYSPFGGKFSERYKKYAYDYTVDYSANKADVNFSKTENMESVKKQQSYTKINKKNAYFDNEQLLFVIRGLELKEKYSQSFAVVDPIVSNLQTVAVQVGQEAQYSTIDLKAFTENGETADRSFSVIKVTITLSAQMSGSSFVCYYAAEKDKDNSFNSRLIKMEQTYPGNIGKIVYTLKSVNYNQN